MSKQQLLGKKSLKLLMDEMAGEHRLRRVLGPVGLTSLGVGAIIGTGIFVLVGKVASETTGPSLMLSFVVAGMACVFSALCYAEFASMAPVAGSAYTYAYVTLGELLAWIIGWDLVLEYTVAAATVAHGWSHYFLDLLQILRDYLDLEFLRIPGFLQSAPFDFNAETGEFAWKVVKTAGVEQAAWFDLPALVISLILTVILVIGIRESAGFNAAMVVIKVLIVLFVICVGAFYVNPANWQPFAPYGYTGVSLFGYQIFGEAGKGAPKGMLAGAASIFFAYIGFDSISTHAEEARNPKRDVPIGIIASLSLCTVLYIAVAAVLTGMVPYGKINIDAPVSSAFEAIGLEWARLVVSVGALTGITSVLLVMLLSQPRVLLAMARDGLLPVSFFGAVHDRFKTPWKSTILTGILVAAMGALLPLHILADLTNIGTLLAFTIVCGAVLIMRKTHPDLPRPFKVPLVPLVPLLGVGMCLLLMFSLAPGNWARLFIWLAVGLLIYFLYGYRHSHLGKELRGELARHGISPAGMPKD